MYFVSVNDLQNTFECKCSFSSASEDPLREERLAEVVKEEYYGRDSVLRNSRESQLLGLQLKQNSVVSCKIQYFPWHDGYVSNYMSESCAIYLIVKNARWHNSLQHFWMPVLSKQLYEI